MSFYGYTPIVTDWQGPIERAAGHFGKALGAGVDALIGGVTGQAGQRKLLEQETENVGREFGDVFGGGQSETPMPNISPATALLPTQAAGPSFGAGSIGSFASGGPVLRDLTPKPEDGSEAGGTGVDDYKVKMFVAQYLAKPPGVSWDKWREELPKQRERMYADLTKRKHAQALPAFHDAIGEGSPWNAAGRDADAFLQSKKDASYTHTQPTEAPPSQMLRGEATWREKAAQTAEQEAAPMYAFNTKRDAADVPAREPTQGGWNAGARLRGDMGWNTADADTVDGYGWDKKGRGWTEGPQAAAGAGETGAAVDVKEMEAVGASLLARNMSVPEKMRELIKWRSADKISKDTFDMWWKLYEGEISGAQKDALIQARAELEFYKQERLSERFQKGLESREGIAAAQQNNQREIAQGNNATSKENNKLRVAASIANTAGTNSSHEDIANKNRAAVTARLAMQGKLDGTDPNTNKKGTTGKTQDEIDAEKEAALSKLVGKIPDKTRKQIVNGPEFNKLKPKPRRGTPAEMGAIINIYNGNEKYNKGNKIN